MPTPVVGTRPSLTLRISLLTFAMLLLASLVTYGILAVVTPVSYVTLSADMFSDGIYELAARLDGSSYDEGEDIIRLFINEYSSNVTLIDPDGVIDRVFFANDVAANGTFLVEAIEGDHASVTVAAAPGESGVTPAAEYYVSVSDYYPFSFSDRNGIYSLNVSPITYPVNMVSEAFVKTAPWLFLAVLTFSALCSFFYSRFVAKLRDANAALERDIEQKREREEERLAFFSAVSHELKTPITILKGQLSGMLDGVDVYRDRDKYLARALTVTGRMEGIVRELLTVARLETLPSEGGEADISALVNKSLELYDELILQKGLKKHTELADGVLARGDEKLLAKALDSILCNAVFYSPEGADITVTLAQENDGRAELTVVNGGAAIPEDDLPHLFEAFYRAEKSRSRATGGSGMGLYLVKTILEKQGAEYAIENTDEGVRFTVRFAAIR